MSFGSDLMNDMAPQPEPKITTRGLLVLVDESML